MRPFRIHSICVVKNEVDIVPHCLRVALAWSDRILVYDGASTDGTWEAVCALAKEDSRIVPWKQDGKVFQESLRAEVFNAFRDGVEDGDWWCHLDSDEFYVQDPKAFLAKVKRPHHTVWGIPVEYYLTTEDVATLDFSLPAEALLPQIRGYKITNSEPRFFRHRPRLQWPTTVGWPIHMGPVWPERICYRHYKYRSPEQIKLRLKTRQDNIARGFPGWEHARQASWEQALAKRENLHQDQGNQQFVYDEAKIPSHRDPGHKHALKLVMHGLGIWP